MKKRQNKSPDLGTRSLRLRLDAGGKPASLDEANRSVEIVVATETDTVMVYDWELGRVPEILLMSGCRNVDQVPLLDTHSREGVANVLGSVRDIRAEGDEMLGRAYYSSVQEAVDAFTKTAEGHLTDYSAGYRPISTTVVAEKETVILDGRSFTGPCLVITEWELKEVSTCPIGADNRAKARALDTTNQEDMEMKEFLRKMRVKLALPEEATEDQIRAAIEDAAEKAEAAKVTQRAQDATPPPAAAAAPNTEDLKRQAVAEERARTAEITALCETHGCRELAAELLKGDTTVAEAQRQVLTSLQSRAAGTQTPGFQVEVITDERDKFRAAAEDGLRLRAGHKVEKPASGSDVLRSYTLREMVRECLTRSNQAIPADPREMVNRALTTSDLPNILANVANKSLMAGWDEETETFDQWVDTSGSLADFKLADLVRRGETSDLLEVKEDGEFKYGQTTDTKEQVRLLTWGRIIKISRQAIINDDLGALTDVPKDLGGASRRLLGDLAYDVLIANANMGDGKPLFGTDHANKAGTGSVISLASLNEGELAMGMQKDLLALRRLNIPVAFLLAPLSLKGSAEQFFNTQLIGGETDQPNLVNTWFGPKIQRVYDTRLDDDSIKAWYLAGRKGKTVKMFFLNGMQTPFLEQRVGWDVDGLEIKARLDAAAKALDFRGLYQNTGPST